MCVRVCDLCSSTYEHHVDDRGFLMFSFVNSIHTLSLGLILRYSGESLGADLYNIDDVINYLLKNGHRVISCKLSDIVYNPLGQVSIQVCVHACMYGYSTKNYIVCAIIQHIVEYK